MESTTIRYYEDSYQFWVREIESIEEDDILKDITSTFRDLIDYRINHVTGKLWCEVILQDGSGQRYKFLEGRIVKGIKVDAQYV